MLNSLELSYQTYVLRLIAMIKIITFSFFLSKVFLIHAAVLHSDSQAQVYLDHVIIAVSDLESASQNYKELGFTLKEGRLHTNGLLNRFAKFRDGTELELMTVVGNPKDEMAQGYSNFLQFGEGGAFLAFRASPSHVLEASKAVGITAVAQKSGWFHFVTFSEPGLENVFFIEYEQVTQNPDSIFQHKNGVVGLEEVWIEASPKLGQLLNALNVHESGETKSPNGLKGIRYGIGVVITEFQHDLRPRVLGVKLQSSTSQYSEFFEPEAASGIWIELSSLTQ